MSKNINPTSLHPSLKASENTVKLRRTGSFIALLLFATTFNTHSMEPQQPSRWVVLAGAAIIGGYVVYKQFLSYIETKPFPFAELPFDKQYLIITLLAQENNATSLKEAAKTINSLAQVNHELNELINDPEFCLTLIKHLSQEFNCSDQEAAETLQTQEAKRRLELQVKLQRLCVNGDPENKFKDLYQQDIDLSFTYYYNSHFHHSPEFFYIPLTSAIILHHFSVACDIITCALDKNLNIVNLVNKSNITGNTALITCIRESHNLYGKNYAYETRDKYKGTNRMPIYFDCLDTIKYLLKCGADPELANAVGLTPLAAAQETDNQEVIDLIQDAINRKHGDKS